jgi:hypothetical protein
MAQLITLDELRTRLGWRDMTEDVPMAGWRVFSVWPADRSLPAIEFLFDADVSFLQQLGFGPWHGHYSESSDERRNLRRAIATARALVAGTRCLLVQRSASGAYLGSGIYRLPLLPLMLSRDFARLERLVFGATSEGVPIDLSRYHRGRGGYIEHAWRRRLKEDLADSPVDTSLFD